MKKLLVGVLCVVFAFGLYGCGQPSPTDVVEEALDAAKSKDAKTFNGVYLGEDLDFDALVKENATDTGLSKESQALLQQKLFSFDYTTDKEEVNDSKAAVTVTITTYDFASAVQTFFSDALSKSFSLSFSGASEEEINNAMEESMKTALNGLTEKTKTTTANVNLTNGDNGWSIDDLTQNTEFIDAVTGGAYSKLEEVENNFNSLDIDETE